VSAHTPGPWETSVDDSGQWDVCAEGGGDMIADLSGSEHGEADARLIAAAPELLATLKDAREELRLLREKDGCGPYDPTLKGRIDAVITQAE